MLTVALYPNMVKPESQYIIKQIVDFWIKRKARLIAPEKAASCETLADYAVANIENIPADLALCLGGDGTLLGVCRRYANNPVPVCGINIGTLGFLADIELYELENRLNKLYEGDFRVEQRPLLMGSVINGNTGEEQFLSYAINDIVVTKGDTARILSLGLSVNDNHLVDCNADGFILATPTGSTAYSLSAGGPIMNPMVKGFLLTPICAHTLNIRPLVIAEDDVVKIHLKDTPQQIIASFDGQEQYELQPGDTVVGRISDLHAGVIKFKDKDYYHILRTKLWKNM